MEIQKVINLITSFSHTDYGKEFLLQNTKMYTDYSKLDREINISRTFFDMVLKDEIKDLYSITFINNILEKIEKKEIITGIEFRKIGMFLAEGNSIFKYYNEKIEFLVEELNHFNPLIYLKDKVFKTFSDEGEIKDTATLELKNIRNEINNVKSHISSEFNRIKNRYLKYLSIDKPIERNSRVCVALKSENRQILKGITVGKSDSGATIFVEPESILILNDKLIDLISKEKTEINKILSILTFEIQKNIDKLKENVKIIGYIDSNIAKARYAQQMQGVFIKPSKKREILLKELKHPLISKEKVVPIDVKLDKNGMIITGPNTGGKTVSLKSIGLAFFMAHAGLPVLVLKGEVPRIKEIYTDIGDEQDISQNLSTFSSHLVNLKSILENVDEYSVVLIDELGTGTDPIEGASLSKAIIKFLLTKDTRIFATSHLSEIKAYSLEEDRLISASMSFDLETLQPTYRLMVGVPGASHAIEIAEKLGIKSEIIEEARRNLNKDFANNEKILYSISRLHKEYEERKERIRKNEKEIAELKSEYQTKLQKLKEKEIEKLDSEIDQLKTQVKSLKKQIQELLEILNFKKEDLNPEDLKNMLKKSEEISKKLSDTEKLIEQKQNKKKKANIFLKEGMKVKVPGNMEGIVKNINQSKITVQINDSPIEITYSPLEIEPLITYKEGKNNKKEINVRINQKKDIKPEIDIRGFSVNEAIPEIEKFISDLMSAGIKEGRIIHGKGTGKLAEGVWDFLRKSHLIKDFKIAKTEEGGTGATIIEV